MTFKLFLGIYGGNEAVLDHLSEIEKIKKSLKTYVCTNDKNLIISFNCSTFPKCYIF